MENTMAVSYHVHDTSTIFRCVRITTTLKRGPYFRLSIGGVTVYLEDADQLKRLYVELGNALAEATLQPKRDDQEEK